MATKVEKLLNESNNRFTAFIYKAMRQEYGICVETTSDYSYRLVTTRADGEDFSVEQLMYLKGLSEGYKEAQSILEEEVYK